MVQRAVERATARSGTPAALRHPRQCCGPADCCSPPSARLVLQLHVPLPRIPLITSPLLLAPPTLSTCLQHVLFLDGSPKEGTIGFESAAMRHIAAAVLESRPHQARVELARTLLEWQKASAAAAELSSRSRSIWGWLGDAVGLNISKAAVADARVESLAAKIERLRPLVPLSPGIKSEAPALMEGSGD